MIAATTMLAMVTTALIVHGSNATSRPPVPNENPLFPPTTRRVSLPRRQMPPVVTPLALANWCDDLARSLRHGATLRASLIEVQPQDPAIRDHTGALRHWLDRGASVPEACDEWFDDVAASSANRTELLAALASVLAATALLGGNSAAPLDRFAATMRQRASDDLERGSQSAQAALSAKVLTLVPLAILALLLATDAEVRDVVTGTAGAATVALGLMLNLLGAAWMRRIVSPRGARP
ncbi:MAG: type II secretion system F family protein [Ilumatobacter sp.]